MTPEEAQERLGFRLVGSNLEFTEHDRGLMGRKIKGADGKQHPVDYLGTSRSGARPASNAEIRMWELLTAPVAVAE